MRLFANGVLNRELAKGRAAELIAPLDDWRPDDEYARRELAVTLADGTTASAFAHCYVRDLPGDAEPIPGGNFGAWLRETGRRAISGRD